MAVERSDASGPLAHEQGRLLRTLSGFANFALTYSGVGASAGLFTLYGLSIASSGPAFFWGWPLVALGSLLLCLIWAELSSHYPYAGVMYQWPSLLLGRRVGWWVGWMYLFAAIFLATSAYLVVPIGIASLFETSFTQNQSVGLALVALAVATVLNALGIRVLGRFTELSVVIELVVIAGIVLLVLLFGAHHSPSVLVHTAGTGGSFHHWTSGFLGGGILISLWVMFTFENGGTLGEETTEAARNAPRAVLGAFAMTALMGLVFLFVFIISAPSIAGQIKSGTPLQDTIDGALPHVFTVIYLVVILGVMILGANVAFTAAVRQLFSMARDDALPAARALSTTRNGTPWVAVLVVAVITGLPFIFSKDFAVLITATTGFFYVIYLAVMLIVLIARLRGWPATASDAPFRLGGWGLPVNVAAIAWSALMMLDLLWPRDLTNPIWHGTRVSVWLIGVPLIVGALYYVLFQHRQRERAPSTPRAS